MFRIRAKKHVVAAVVLLAHKKNDVPLELRPILRGASSSGLIVNCLIYAASLLRSSRALAMDTLLTKQRTDWSLVRKALKEARPCCPHLAGISLLCLLSTPVMLLAPLPLKIAVDSVLGTHSLPGWLRILP
jgi:hypothetical protein